MQDQLEESRKPIGKIIQDRNRTSSFSDTRIRISKDFTFFGVTQTRSGEAITALALKVILASGEQLLVQYHEIISPIKYDGVGKIEISTPYISISIEGKNLDDLIEYLAEHRLMWIKEPDSDWDVPPQEKASVKKIEVVEN